MARAVTAAAEAAVAVVVVGTNADWETEGEDRTTMDLPGAQDELIRRVAAVNPRTVVVVNAGSPVTMPWLDDVAAVLQVWFPGEEFGEALADVLFGVEEPGGRLPITFPRRLEDTPAFPYHPGHDDRTVYGEGLFIGHRWYDAQSIEPLFPFGHGLGYTSWELVDAHAEGTPDSGVTVHATVRNTGRRRGSTVVQCYVEPRSVADDRPLRTLQGFAKVRAEPGASVEVTVELSPRAFSRWDTTAHDWLVVPGAHRLLVGWSSRDLTPVDASPATAAG
jgi:beta-glucosidase